MLLLLYEFCKNIWILKCKYLKIFNNWQNEFYIILLLLQIQCYKSVDASFDCITEDVLANVEQILINEEIEKAKNQSDFLGDQYIASCGIITSYKTNVVNQYYGPNAPCTYDEIIEALDTKNSCINDLTQKIAFLESIANSV